MKEYISNLYKIIRHPELRILPGNLAFFLILSIIPTVSLVGLIGSLFSISVSDVVAFLKFAIPNDVYELLISFMSNANMGNYIIYIIIGFVTASNGPHAIILVSNTLYNVKSSNYIIRRIKAFFLTVLFIILFFIILIVLTFGNSIVKFILGLNVFQLVSENIYQTFILFKWPIAFILMFIFVKLIYTLAPDKKISSKYVNTGAAFTTIGWSFVTAIYSYYANNMANYALFYGNMSNIIILMIWIYIISYIFVIGILINANEYQFLEEKMMDKK